MSSTLSSSLARDWMSSRSRGVMKVLFSSAKTVWTISSAWCSASLIRRTFIGTSRKSCSNSSSEIAASSTVSASFSRRSKNWRSCGIIHPFKPIVPHSWWMLSSDTSLRCRIRVVLSAFVEAHPGRLELLQELLSHLSVSGEPLDRLAGHLVVPKELLHVARRYPSPASDSLDAGRLHDLRLRHLVVRHRVHDDLEP